MASVGVRILHVSDTHLGYSGGTRFDQVTHRNIRTLDFERSWMAACVRAAQPDIDLVIHSGDAFHHPRPSYATIRSFVTGLQMVAAPVVVIGGNHDTPRLRLTSSPFSVAEPALPNVYFAVGYDVQVFYVAGVMVACVPWARLVDPRPIGLTPHPHMTSILVSHGDVPTGAFASGEPGHGAVPEYLLRLPWDYVALGHIHKSHEAWSPAWYAGSTERCGWSDAEGTPGYLIVDISGSTPTVVTREVVPHRQFLNLGERSLDDLEALKAPDAVARVKFPGVTRADARSVIGKARRERWFLDLRVDLDTPFAPTFAKVETEGPVDLHEWFRDFVEMRDLPEKTKAVLLETGTRAIEKAEAEEAARERVD